MNNDNEIELICVFFRYFRLLVHCQLSFHFALHVRYQQQAALVSEHQPLDSNPESINHFVNLQNKALANAERGCRP